MKLSTAMVFALSLGVSGFALAAEELLMEPQAIPPGSQTTATDRPALTGHPEGGIVIKFSHAEAPDTPKGRAAERFKQLAEQSTNGQVRVEIYPGGQLYNDGEEIEALQSDTVQMLAPSLSRFGQIGVREFELFDLPYIFPNREILHRFLDGGAGKNLFRKLSAKGLTGLAYWDNGFKQMSSNKAMHKVADLKGLTMRIQPSKVLEAQMTTLGANPQAMVSGEVYNAMQQGVVDGGENPVSDFHSRKLHQVQKHLTISNHGYLGYAVIVNKRFWEGLPADVREALTQSMDETTLFERDIAQKENDDALDNVIAANTTEVYVLSPRERISWHQALLPVYQEFENVIGKYLIRSVGYAAAQVKKERDAARPKGKTATKK
jgi:C4-dicarboxylate-binding protein DctP